MTTSTFLRLEEIERRVCDLTAVQLGLPRTKVAPSSRLVEDLHCDSLDLVELLMELEEAFSVTLPNEPHNSVYKVVFVRSPFRLADLAELIYLQQGTGAPPRKTWRRSPTPPMIDTPPLFTQLGGRWQPGDSPGAALLESLDSPNGLQFRRATDGMRCLRIPSAEVEIGSAAAGALPDERPLHVAGIDSFVIDAEPVSTTAYCRFLNSIEGATPQHLADWFLLDADDDRAEHLPIEPTKSGWQPTGGAERRPMMLVSWLGANAYSLWANRSDWRRYRAEPDDAWSCCLPTEAQWEYAARGARRREFPSGDAEPSPSESRFGQHCPAAAYTIDQLPLAAVNAPLGMSPFGLHHMAGNIWQWCRDWYDPRFYHSPRASAPNPRNDHPTGVRSERGGSWVGPASLCRSSHRRARHPAARGRCLGFRCITASTRM